MPERTDPLPHSNLRTGPRSLDLRAEMGIEKSKTRPKLRRNFKPLFERNNSHRDRGGSFAMLSFKKIARQEIPSEFLSQIRYPEKMINDILYYERSKTNPKNHIGSCYETKRHN